MTWLNEAIGPNAANDLLLAATQRLDRMVPDTSIIARTGGDSFGIFIDNIDIEGLEPIAERLVQSFREQHFVTHDSALNVSVSVGAVIVPESAANGITALTRAEQALKTGRSNGRSAFRLYEDSEDRRSYHLSSLAELDRYIKPLPVIISCSPISPLSTPSVARWHLPKDCCACASRMAAIRWLSR